MPAAKLESPVPRCIAQRHVPPLNMGLWGAHKLNSRIIQHFQRCTLAQVWQYWRRRGLGPEPAGAGQRSGRRQGELGPWRQQTSAHTGCPNAGSRQASTSFGQPLWQGRGLGGWLFEVQSGAEKLSPPAVPQVVSVACGWRHSAAVDDGGRLFVWGWGRWGQLGLGDTK